MKQNKKNVINGIVRDKVHSFVLCYTQFICEKDYVQFLQLHSQTMRKMTLVNAFE